MPRKQSKQEEPVDPIDAEVIEVASKRGRKIKYQTEEERRAARRDQNRKYRERKKQELISLRREAAKAEPEGTGESA